MADNEDVTLTEEQKKAIVVEVENRLRPEIEKTVRAEFEEKIALARAEEKNKLYPEITKLKEEAKTKDSKIAEFTKNLATANDKLAESEKKIADLEANGGNDEATATKIKELEDRLAKALEGKDDMSAESIKSLEEKIALLEKRDEERTKEIEKLNIQKKIEAYRAEKIKDLDESVQDLVSGSTNEEIDASYDKAKAAFEKLTKKLGADINSLPKVPSSMLNNPDILKSVNTDDISKTSDDEWKEMRKKLGFDRYDRKH